MSLITQVRLCSITLQDLCSSFITCIIWGYGVRWRRTPLSSRFLTLTFIPSNFPSKERCIPSVLLLSLCPGCNWGDLNGHLPLMHTGSPFSPLLEGFRYEIQKTQISSHGIHYTEVKFQTQGGWLLSGYLKSQNFLTKRKWVHRQWLLKILWPFSMSGFPEFPCQSPLCY